MTTAALLAVGPDAQALGDWLLRGLAVVGAAALGGFLAGLILQVGAKALAAQTVPKKVLQPVRVIGAIAVGVLVGYILFHGGGGGGGKDGLWPFGGGGKDGESKDQQQSPKEVVVKKDETRAEETKKDAAAKTGPALTIEVLGDERAKGDRIYRVEGETGLKDLAEVRKVVEARKEKGLQRVRIVLYRNSPDRDTAVVKALVEVVRDKGLTPDISEPPSDAP